MDDAVLLCESAAEALYLISLSGHPHAVNLKIAFSQAVTKRMAVSADRPSEDAALLASAIISELGSVSFKTAPRQVRTNQDQSDAILLFTVCLEAVLLQLSRGFVAQGDVARIVHRVEARFGAVENQCRHKSEAFDDMIVCLAEIVDFTRGGSYHSADNLTFVSIKSTAYIAAASHPTTRQEGRYSKPAQAAQRERLKSMRQTAALQEAVIINGKAAERRNTRRAQ